jgi:hypothetical protein
MRKAHLLLSMKTLRKDALHARSVRIPVLAPVTRSHTLRNACSYWIKTLWFHV